ncbi:hypothetical protein [Lacrimispora amygdalina]|uniref:hypothetical protein n=1 Tax=Lacrimispora amygdalina TaxID=253257 RepID=UPI000BE25484|nr:hypothetical protein [Lacrimispora amygdalina]
MNHINEAFEYIQTLNTGGNGEDYLNRFSNSEQLDILLSSKNLLVYVAVERGENMQGACYKCKSRGTIPGDTHSCCKNPLAFALGSEHGVSHGWFFHPFNFDPIWLSYCDGFEAKHD